MSDIMALLISHQNDREREVALERRRLQLEAKAQAALPPAPATPVPGPRRSLWARVYRQEGSVGNSVRTS